MIGQTLKGWREAAGMTQAEAARRLELSPGAVNHHEQGRNVPCPADVRRYAEIYGRPDGDLVSALLLLAGVGGAEGHGPNSSAITLRADEVTL